MIIKTFNQLLEYSSKKYSDHIAFQIRSDSDYRKIKYSEVATIAARLQAELHKRGVVKGDRVAILSENRPEWGIAFLAITSMGAIAVPLDAMLRLEEISPLIEDSGAKVIVLSHRMVELIRAMRVEGRMIVMEDFYKLLSPEQHITLQIFPHDIASIVYTSGTTGIPKGVMLTHKNIISNIISVASLFDLSPKDNFLSVLPLHHTFETTAGFLGPFYMGCTITYAESLKSYNILRNMQETGVTIMCGVPLLYQLFFEGIMREVEEKNLKVLFSTLFTISKFFKMITGFNIGKFLFSTVHKKFGGKIRFMVTGGAAIDPEILRNFNLMGFTILQGYGLTESAPVLTCCTLKHNKIGSVGKPVPGVEIQLKETPHGEIKAFGPNIMLGYYRQKEMTSEVLAGGWLMTGDVGFLDREGYLFITGRYKDVIVTASGMNVYPEEIEFILNKLPMVKESCVLGTKIKEGFRAGSEQVMALIVPNIEYFEKINMTDDGSIQKIIEEKINHFNQKVADYKRIAKFIIRKTELPKTRLQKIKRYEVKREMGEGI